VLYLSIPLTGDAGLSAVVPIGNINAPVLEKATTDVVMLHKIAVALAVCIAKLPVVSTDSVKPAEEKFKVLAIM